MRRSSVERTTSTSTEAPWILGDGRWEREAKEAACANSPRTPGGSHPLGRPFLPPRQRAYQTHCLARRWMPHRRFPGRRAYCAAKSVGQHLHFGQIVGHVPFGAGRPPTAGGCASEGRQTPATRPRGMISPLADDWPRQAQRRNQLPASLSDSRGSTSSCYEPAGSQGADARGNSWRFGEGEKQATYLCVTKILKAEMK